MRYATQYLGVANNVLKLHNLLLLYMDRKIEYISIDRYNHLVIIIYILQNTTGEVMWSCNVTTIEHEMEKCKSSVF